MVDRKINCEVCNKLMIINHLANRRRFCHSCYKLRHNEKSREWSKNNIEKSRKIKGEWNKRNKEKHAEINRRYAKRNPIKIKAQMKANYYLKHLKKEGYEFHHVDYSKPLEVQIIPIKKHKEIHAFQEIIKS